jgi:hypothetical protein
LDEENLKKFDKNIGLSVLCDQGDALLSLLFCFALGMSLGLAKKTKSD